MLCLYYRHLQLDKRKTQCKSYISLKNQKGHWISVCTFLLLHLFQYALLVGSFNTVFRWFTIVKTNTSSLILLLLLWSTFDQDFTLIRNIELFCFFFFVLFCFKSFPFLFVNSSIFCGSFRVQSEREIPQNTYIIRESLSGFAFSQSCGPVTQSTWG